MSQEREPLSPKEWLRIAIKAVNRLIADDCSWEPYPPSWNVLGCELMGFVKHFGAMATLFLLATFCASAQDSGAAAIPAGNNGDTQCKNGASLTACANNGAIRYVSATGNDANSGLTWDTAKATIYGALIALPGGSASPPTAGAGTVYFGNNVTFSPFGQNYGLWLMNSTDPNFSSPPTGWLRINYSTLNIIGVGCNDWSSNGFTPQCDVNVNDTTSNNAMIQIEGAVPVHLENMKLNGYPGRCIAVGIDSTGNRSNVNLGAGGHSFKNMGCVSQGTTSGGQGRGPTVDIGTNVFDVWFDGVTLGGNTTNQSIIASAATPGLSRSGGTLTITLAAANTAFFTGESCGILGASDPSFNTSVHGTGVGTGITVVNSTTIKMAQSGATLTGGGGVFMCDRNIPVVMDPGTGPGANITFTNAVMNGGGIRQWTNGGAGVTIENVYTEGDYTHCTSPVLWFVASGGGLGQSATVFNGSIADQCGAIANSDLVKVEGSINPENIQIIGASQNPYTEGPMIFHGDNNYYVKNSPLGRNEWGVVRGHLEAQTDVHRHSPQSVRYVNYATNNSASWITTGLTITTGQTDNDGGTGATQAVVPSGSATVSFMSGSNAPGTWNAGDVGICGVWMKSLGTPDPYQGNTALNIACNTAGGSISSFCNLPVVHGDGEWDWYFCGFFVNATASYTNFSTGTLTTSTPIVVYAPTLIHIPSGHVSFNEALRMAYDMRSLPSSCAAGQMCDHIGPIAHSNNLSTYSTQSAATNTNIAATSMVASTSSMHSYLFTWTVSLTAVGVGCSGSTTITLNAIFTDPNASTSTTESLGTITLANTGNGTVGFVANGSDSILAKGGTAVQYSTSSYRAGSGCTTNPTYQVSPTLVQLW